ncbi:MAG: TolC family protein [Acidobacteria bacterium]|nr:TolC family protein [Acidobacteriota bacterium]
MTLAELERRALERNPTMAQARAEIDAAKGRAKQAGLLPNPIIGYSGDEISRGPVIRGGEHGLFVEQTIPLGGKLGLSRTIFERETSQAEALLEAQRLRVVNDVRTLFYSVLAAERRVEVRRHLAALAAEAVGISRQLYNTGAADQPDVLASEIEARQMQVALEAAQNGRFRVWRQLAALVGDTSLTPRPLDGSIDEPTPELQREVALQQALSQSPELKAARAGVERAQAALARARRDPAPDLVLRGGPRYNRELLEADGRPVGWEATVDVGLTIPLFNRNQGGIAESRAELGRAQQELTRLELSLQWRTADVFDVYLTNLRNVEAYKVDVVPRAEESYRLYLARYREMGAAYPQVLVAQRTLFQVTEEYVQSAEMAWMAALQLQGLLLAGGLDASPRVGEGSTGVGQVPGAASSMNRTSGSGRW